ncbi:hypothetical protein HMPREF0578_1200 [Mobiluncus mulieris 28-1]|uniref:ParB/RepB/Spo0J family partition protein n=1 Tax=Mobiluncus mulieris TaxID=2052 RepID=UPI0001BE7A56|nr:ParB/RepB/Spo0J family partition protein [Mobiluncus mulieris]EEZ91964.1 hypothetical protein HMPREF0578_1200 [Mobiluncus mulieris 28-1]
MKRLKADLSQIRLWEQNPRVEATSSQETALKAIYKSGSSENSEVNSRRQLLNLAESISQKGFQTEVDPLVAVEHDGNYIIQDGNRRLSALLLLKNPESYDFLDSRDRKRLKIMREDSNIQLPDKVEMVVFTPDEDTQMKEVISRKHNGPLDGVGVVQWGSKAKQRFTNTQKFSDQLEKPFEGQFGETLSSYLGGADAVTTTQRLFGFKATQKYLNIKDEDISEEVLDRAKKLADALKTRVSETGSPLSRLNAPEVGKIIENIERPPKTSSTGTTAKPEANDIDNIRKTMEAFRDKGPKILGMEFFTEYSFLPEIQEFWLVNRLVLALTKFGALRGDEEDRNLKRLLLCPAVRVFFELSLKGIKASLPNPPKGFKTLSRNHNKNVQTVVDMFTDDNGFLNYLVEAGLYDGYNQARTQITTRKFADSVNESNLASHSADQMLDAQHIETMFNDAVLFVSLCQHYVKYSRDNQTTL